MTVLMILAAVPFLKQVFSDITAKKKAAILLFKLFLDCVQSVWLHHNRCVRSYNSLIEE